MSYLHFKEISQIMKRNYCEPLMYIKRFIFHPQLYVYKKLTDISSIKTFDFNDLFNITKNVDMYRVINALFKEYKNKPNVNNTITEHYFHTLTRFILCHNHIIFNNKMCLGFPQNGKHRIC